MSGHSRATQQEELDIRATRPVPLLGFAMFMREPEEGVSAASTLQCLIDFEHARSKCGGLSRNNSYGGIASTLGSREIESHAKAERGGSDSRENTGTFGRRRGRRSVWLLRCLQALLPRIANIAPV